MSTSVAKIHDRTFSKLVDNPVFVKELVQRYIPERFYREMDWKTLQIERLDTKHISRDLLREIQADLL